MSGARNINRWKSRVGQLRVETYAFYLAYKDPRIPWYAKVFTACVVGYAFSPIDLIPDFIPVFGYLDDLLIIPLGIAVARRMIPGPVLDECRERARVSLDQNKPKYWVTAGFIIAVWLLMIVLIIVLVVGAIQK